MRLPLLSVLGGLATAAWAANPNPFNVPQGFSLAAGKPTTLTWTPTTPGTVTLRLRQGPSNNLEAGTVIQANIPNSGSYTYTPPADTTRGSDYSIEIVSDSDHSQANFTPYFVLESSNTVASTSGASSTSSAPSASSTPSTSAASSTVAAAKTGIESSSTTIASTMTSTSSQSAQTATSTGSSMTKATSTAKKTSKSTSAAGMTSTPTSQPANGAEGMAVPRVLGAILVVLLAAVVSW